LGTGQILSLITLDSPSFDWMNPGLLPGKHCLSVVSIEKFHEKGGLSDFSSESVFTPQGFRNFPMGIKISPGTFLKFVPGILRGLNLGKISSRDTRKRLQMKCGIEKCGRCNVGKYFICKDGPVFTFSQLKKLPPEY
jgi:hypothetical protein